MEKATQKQKEIGKVTHFFSNINVAVIKLTKDPLKAGSTIHIKGHSTDLRQRVDSMQIEHEKITEAKKGQEIGLKVKQEIREHDIVYLV